MLKKHDFVQKRIILRGALFFDLSLTSHRKLNFWALIALGVWKDIFRSQTFDFFQNFVTLSVSHHFGLVFAKKTRFLPKKGRNAGKQTNCKKFLKNTENKYIFLTRIFYLARGPIEQKLYCCKAQLLQKHDFWVKKGYLEGGTGIGA